MTRRRENLSRIKIFSLGRTPGLRAPPGRPHKNRVGSVRRGDHAVGHPFLRKPAAIGDRGLVGTDRRLGARIERQPLGELVLQDRLVLAEDRLLEAIKLNLELEGYKVTTANNGKKALQKFKEERFNLVILDVMMPEVDGFVVAETIRLENSEVPIMFLTAKNTNEDKIAGLKKGADDYLTKPFNLEELILRVNNLVKRSLKGDDLKEFNSYKIGDKTIHFNSFELVNADDSITPLTKKETMLLKLRF